MSARRFFAVEAVAGCAAVLLFWWSPFCVASFVALAVGAVGAVGTVVVVVGE